MYYRNLVAHITHSPGEETGKGGIAVFLHESLTVNIRRDPSVNNVNIETLCVEIINKKSKTFLLTPSIVNQQNILINLSHIWTHFLLNPKLMTKHPF